MQYNKICDNYVNITFNHRDNLFIFVQWVERIKRVKVLLVLVAISIGIGSLLISHSLVSDLQAEEHQKTEIWAEAMRTLNLADENTDLSLVLKVLSSNHTIPVIVLDRNGNVLTSRNIKGAGTRAYVQDSVAYIKSVAMQMRTRGDTMHINLSDNNSLTHDDKNEYLVICYAQSSILNRLAVYPYVQLSVMLLFVAIAVFALLSWKRSEQNRVWVGLSKETAHQLGTPISSLMAWVEILRETYPNDKLVDELDKDVDRLQLVAERFSKIGSVPEHSDTDLRLLVKRVAEYMQRRTSNRIKISIILPEQPLHVQVNASLFEWVIENLCKNAVDAMVDRGEIKINVCAQHGKAIIEVSDTGKGIPHNRFRSVFSPGYTTKKRGWGLGLSLAKRIVEEYHHGRIFVKNSELGKGTTFRIELSLS